MSIIKSIKNIFMPRAKAKKEVNVENTNSEIAGSPLGFNETKGEPITREGFIAYMENMKENEPRKFAKKEAELNKKLEALSE